MPQEKKKSKPDGADNRKDNFHKAFLAFFFASIAGTVATITSMYAEEIRDFINFERNTHGWKTSHEYNKIFDNLKTTHYPIKVSGRLRGGIEEFSAEWLPLPSGKFCFSSYSSMSEDFYIKNGEAAQELGYKEHSASSFKDAQGNKKFQATWIKTTSGPCLP